MTTPATYTDDQLINMKMGHLNMIQGVITRMSTFGAAAKTFTVTALAGLIAISLQANPYSLGMIALIITILFLATDLYYLKLEIQFRSLYDHVASRPLDQASDLSIAPRKNADDMKHALSSPVVLFYVVILVAALVFSGVGLANDSFSKRSSRADSASVKRADVNANLTAGRPGEPVLVSAPGIDGAGQRIPRPTATQRLEPADVRHPAAAGVPTSDR